MIKPAKLNRGDKVATISSGVRTNGHLDEVKLAAFFKAVHEN